MDKKPQYGPKEHQEICQELLGLYIAKNEAYGNSFHDTFLEEGLAAARIRLGDKMNRFKTLSRNPDFRASEALSETLRDTLLDMANYAIMTIMEIDWATDNER